MDGLLGHLEQLLCLVWVKEEIEQCQQGYQQFVLLEEMLHIQGQAQLSV